MLTSSLWKLAFATIRSEYTELNTGWGCIHVVHKVLWVPMGQLQVPPGEHLSSPWLLVKTMFLWYLSRSGWCSPSLYCASVMKLMTEYPGLVGREMGRRQQPTQLGKLGTYSLTVTVCEIPWAEKGSAGTELCQLGRGWCGDSEGVLTFFSLPNFGSFLHQQHAIISWLDSWTSTKAVLSMGGLPKSVFSSVPGTWSREPKASSWTTSESTTRTKVCLPATQFTDRQGFSQFPVCVLLDPTASRKVHLLWLDTKLFSIGGWSKGHLIQLSCWCYVPPSIF